MKNDRNEKKLTAAQATVVKRGQKAGLTEKQISVYADPAFSPEQMEEIRLGFLDGLTPSQIRVFADPLVQVDEMTRIRKIYRMADEIEQDMDNLTHMIEAAEHRTKPSSLRQFSLRKPGR